MQLLMMLHGEEECDQAIEGEAITFEDYVWETTKIALTKKVSDCAKFCPKLYYCMQKQTQQKLKANDHDLLKKYKTLKASGRRNINA